MAGEDELQRLADIEAIKLLRGRYTRAVDTKDWDLFGDSLAEDARLSTDHGVTEGRAAMVEFISTALATAKTVHHVHQPEIELTGPDTARGIWAMIDYVEWPEEGGVRRGVEGHGHYHEDYLKVDGEWKIAKLRLTRLRANGLPVALAPFYWEPASATKE